MSFHFHGHHNHDWSNPSNWHGGISPDGWKHTQVTYHHGAVIELSQNVDVDSLRFSGSGTLTIKGNGNEILNNGTTTIDRGVTIVLDGTNIVGGDGGASAGPLEGDGTLVVKGGSNLNVGGMNTNLVFDNTSGYSTLTVNWTRTITGSIYNLTPGDTIDLHSSDSWVSSIVWEQNGDGSYRIVSPAPDQWNKPTTLIDHVTLAPGISPSDFTWENGELVCYLRGTPILTDNGPVAVENLRVGGSVMTLRDSEFVPSKITWVGWKKAIVDTTCDHDDIAGWPVTIKAGAISDNSPVMDVSVTAEHCLFIEGNFIPVRMLINGKSIYYDKTVTQYDYFHFETENGHDVVSVAGLLSESFLDTGNKKSFNSSTVGGFSNKTWEDAAAPLNTSVEFVEPIWKRIAGRAGISHETVNESKEVFLTCNGKRIDPLSRRGKFVTFSIPENVEEVTIESDSSRPFDTIGPFVDDRRNLGVLVGDVSLFTGKSSDTVTDYMSNEMGWHGPHGSQRWTNGKGIVNIGGVGKLSKRILSLRIDA